MASSDEKDRLFKAAGLGDDTGGYKPLGALTRNMHKDETLPLIAAVDRSLAKQGQAGIHQAIPYQAIPHQAVPPQAVPPQAVPQQAPSHLAAPYQSVPTEGMGAFRMPSPAHPAALVPGGYAAAPAPAEPAPVPLIRPAAEASTAEAASAAGLAHIFKRLDRTSTLPSPEDRSAVGETPLRPLFDRLR